MMTVSELKHYDTSERLQREIQAAHTTAASFLGGVTVALDIENTNQQAPVCVLSKRTVPMAWQEPLLLAQYLEALDNQDPVNALVVDLKAVLG